ncbi:hypothetical protein [Janibacter melonis]|uniref:hypothetical protein n=1 Tax=Janibacter melonis TaxID=262209 RepID=UPI0018DC75ED|nr:hypothetical protein [Janibacter melonis]
MSLHVAPAGTTTSSSMVRPVIVPEHVRSAWAGAATATRPVVARAAVARVLMIRVVDLLVSSVSGSGAGAPREQRCRVRVMPG